jgi:hypothetical protein
MSKLPEFNDDEKELAKRLGLSYSDIHLLHLILVRKDILNDAIKTFKDSIGNKEFEINILDEKYKEILNKVN